MHTRYIARSFRHLPAIVAATGITAGLFPGSLLSAEGTSIYLDDGEPSGFEEEIRWLANRARFDPARENEVRGTYFGGLPATAQPMSPNRLLIRAARHHSEDLARNNAVGHATVPGSTYYNPSTQPGFEQRALAEGYSLWGGAEIISYQYPTATEHHVRTWGSDEHRPLMMYPDWRETGPGHFHLAGSQWGHYSTVGMSGTWYQCYFTGTLFHDASGDAAYQAGEGVEGVVVKLQVDGTPFPTGDQSGQAGNFTIPLHSIEPGSQIEVLLENPTSSAVSLSIPRDYDTLDEITLPAGAVMRIGTFTSSSAPLNVGLRNIDPEATLLVSPSPTLAISRTGSQVELQWDSHEGSEYLLQWTENLTTWTDDAAGYQVGTGTAMTRIQPLALSGRRLFRVVSRPR